MATNGCGITLAIAPKLFLRPLIMIRRRSVNIESHLFSNSQLELVQPMPKPVVQDSAQQDFNIAQANAPIDPMEPVQTVIAYSPKTVS